MGECGCANGVNLVYACSGGSNVGQIANDAAKALDGLGQARMSCGIGVGASLPSFLEGARKADKRVVIDGCSTGCMMKALTNAGLIADVHVVVTDLGIEKGHHFDYSRDEVAKAAGAAADALKAESACCPAREGQR